MKKTLVLIIFVVLAAALLSGAEENKKVLNIQKAYVYMKEALLISDTDLNCSYFIKDAVPDDITIVSKHLTEAERNEFSDHDELVINKGGKDGLKEGDMLQIMSAGQVVHSALNHDRLGRYFLKKSLATITCIYDHQAVIRLQKGCYPINIGDIAVLYKPEGTLFAKGIDYKFCRIPANAMTGTVVFSELSMGFPAESAGDSQYVTVDLGEGVAGKGSFLLIYRVLHSDLPPLIVGLGIVIHSENTNCTVKILDSSSDIRIRDKVVLLPKTEEGGAAASGEKIPIVEALQNQEAAAANQAQGVEPGKGNALNVDVLFDFDSKQPIADHAADFAAIKDFVAAKSEYLVTLRGYTCSIGGEEYNLRLSSARVETIKNILISQYGIDAAHIETFFYGEKDPQFDNSSEAERRKNRLVKIEVNGK
jgi:outer membrane protein OmpA-like peptidoglycan-associated protein